MSATNTKQPLGAARRWLMVVVSALSLTVVGAGCGDDGGGGTKTAKKTNAPKATRSSGSKGRSRGKKKEARLKIYDKLEDVVTSEDEAKRIRKRARPRNFTPDPTGDDNRDPFRSYVVRTPVQSLTEGSDINVSTTEVCTPSKMRAPNPKSKDPRARKSYSLRDLRLAGIVLRGARSFAMFRDNSGYGHLVRKGDCLGTEKARVMKIGAGFVRLEVLPEATGNQTTREPQKREIQLHPEELQLDEGDLEGEPEQ